jgi:hypothetical protein
MVFDYTRMFKLLGKDQKYNAKFERYCANCGQQQELKFTDANAYVTHPLRCKCGMIVFVTLIKDQEGNTGFTVSGE